MMRLRINKERRYEVSEAICIMGQSGSGKTYSMRFLDPKETFYIDCDGKGLNWKGWKKQYNKTNKNYYRNDNPDTVLSVIKQIDKEQKHVKNIIVDTINGIMIGDEMRRMKEKGYDKWSDLAQTVYYIVHDANLYREDLNIILVAHIQVEDDGFTRILTNGKKLNKTQLETMLNNVLLAKRVEGEYVFEVVPSNNTVKTFNGLFETETIPNNIVDVIKAIREF